MSFNLMQSLGLNQVESDPNALPDGKWPGVVFKSELVFVEKKNTISHVITYKVTDGERKGAQRQEWFELGKDPKYDEQKNLIGLDLTMTDERKSWYKKRFEDLGIHPDSVESTDPKDLVGIPVIFGTKKNQGYININFVEVRQDASETFTAAAESGGGNPASLI